MRCYYAEMQANINAAAEATLSELRSRAARLQMSTNGAINDISNHMFPLLTSYTPTHSVVPQAWSLCLFWTNCVSLQPLCSVFLWGFSVSLSGRVLLNMIQIISSLLVVAFSSWVMGRACPTSVTRRVPSTLNEHS